MIVLHPKDTDSESTDSKKDEKGNNEPINNSKEDSYVRLIIEIVVGVLIFIACVVIVFFVIKWKKERKKRVDELLDDYEYIPEGKNIN